MKGHADLYRIRVGAYRAVYEVDDTPFEEGEIAYSGLVTVTIIAHRREVYD